MHKSGTGRGFAKIAKISTPQCPRLVPSRHRASLLSMIAFVESALIGIGCLVLGVLMDGLGSSEGMAAYAAAPPAGICLL
ncbi:hypothetical protein STRTUCAR8_08287 [Streptomyces turgidiscabies Car8]|uniref:Uncharacterized protein n=1 Tax=Streptomyces turgidiscabies (strain Car8) TaxID=698760 RepID=L7F028_STRT8|nr:hypothetical protein STRTUCAR8_08287 [Streptomyces turgidiscabies Car8]